MAWVVTDLAPLQTRTFSTTHLPVPASATLSHVETPASFESSSNAIGFASSLDTPVPITAINGQGGGTFYGSPVTSHSAEVTAHGPVWNEVRHTLTLEDGTAVTITLRQWDRSNRFEVAVDVDGDSPASGWRITLPDVHTWHHQHLYGASPYAPPDTHIGDWFTVPIAGLDGQITRVRPWGAWWGNDRVVVCFEYGQYGREIHVGRLEPVEWTNLAHIPIIASEGRISLDVAFQQGKRRFWIGESARDESVGWRHRRDHLNRRIGSQSVPYQYGLETVRQWVLDWEDDQPHPSALMTQEEVEAARPTWLPPERIPSPPGQNPIHNGHPDSGHPRGVALYLINGVDEWGSLHVLESNLALLGDFDKMRYTMDVSAQYDALLPIASNPNLLRAQMAYLAYVTMDPTTWDVSRGWMTGNYNMQVSYGAQAPAWLSAVLASHPMAGTWRAKGETKLDESLSLVGPAGEWPESSGYSEGAVGELLQAALLLGRTDDPRLKRTIEYLTKIKPPKDPRMGGARVLTPYGRTMGADNALDGVLGRATDNPEMTWSWAQAGNQELTAHLGGFQYVYLDPRREQAPIAYQSELFPEAGILFRRDQDFCFLLSGDHDHMIYGSQTGSIASLWYRGIPLGGAFVHTYTKGGNEWVQSRVSGARHPRDYVENESPYYWRAGPARAFGFDDTRTHARYQDQIGDGNPATLVTLDSMEYGVVDVAPDQYKTYHNPIPADIPWPEQPNGVASGPFKWRRQCLWAHRRYWVLRDTTDGSQPTHWSFWTASNGIDAPGPGNAIEQPRMLSGPLHRALGAHGCDLQYYIAKGGESQHTARWGTETNVSGPWGITQYQDALILQSAGGVYFVVLYPLEPGEPTPSFGSLADGAVIGITTADRTDYIMMAAERTVVDLDGIYFDTTCGMISVSAGQVTLALGAEGVTRYHGRSLSSTTSAEETFPL